MEIRQKFSNERYAMDFESAPLSVRAGKVLLWIGSILFFIASFFDLVIFAVSLIIPEVRSSIDFQDPGQMFQFVNLPVLAVLFIFAGIGGIAQGQTPLHPLCDYFAFRGRHRHGRLHPQSCLWHHQSRRKRSRRVGKVLPFSA